MGDNGELKGELKPEKTPEQLATERLVRYQKNPDSFIELSEIVCVARKSHKSELGVSICIDGSSRVLMNNAIVELNHMADKIRLQQDYEREKSQVVPVKHGILNFRRLLRK